MLPWYSIYLVARGAHHCHWTPKKPCGDLQEGRISASRLLWARRNYWGGKGLICTSIAWESWSLLVKIHLKTGVAEPTLPSSGAESCTHILTGHLGLSLPIPWWGMEMQHQPGQSKGSTLPTNAGGCSLRTLVEQKGKLRPVPHYLELTQMSPLSTISFRKRWATWLDSGFHHPRVVPSSRNGGVQQKRRGEDIAECHFIRYFHCLRRDDL